MRSKKKKCWSQSLGFYGAKVRVSELSPGGVLYLLWVDSSGKQRKKSLGHRDRKRGRDAALEYASRLAQYREDIEAARLTVERLFDIYVQTGLAGTTEQYRLEARRKLLRWVEFLGPSREVESLSPADVRAFAEARQEGARAIGRKPLSQTTIWHDFVALNTALNWLVSYTDAKGRRLLKVNPLNGVSLSKSASPAQPVARDDLFETLKGVAPKLGAQFSLALDLAYATGHRIGAILHLRWDDIDFESSEFAPHGSIHWRKEHDKIDNDHVRPMNEIAARSLADAHETVQGQPHSGWVFPSQTDPERPVERRLVSRWFRKALRLASVPPERGLGWHAFRRGWATARKHLPDVDVAAAGGWRDTATMKRCYQHADAAGVLRAIFAEQPKQRESSKELSQPRKGTTALIA